MKRNAANKPGSLTRVFNEGPVGMYCNIPDGKSYADIANESIEDIDGFVMIIASRDCWRFVLTTSRKIGWVDAHDLGIGIVPGTVYLIDFAK